MRAAPAVAVDLPGSRRWDVGSALLGGAAFAAAAAAGCAHLELPAFVAGAAVGAAALAGAALLWRLRPQGCGQVRWDGAAWWYRPAVAGAAEAAGQLRVAMDFGHWMLLRFDAEASRGRPVWLPVSGRRVARAGELRAAVYCRGLNPENPARREREPQ